MQNHVKASWSFECHDCGFLIKYTYNVNVIPTFKISGAILKKYAFIKCVMIIANF